MIERFKYLKIVNQGNVSKVIKPSLRGRLARSNPLITSILDYFASLAMTENLHFETASLKWTISLFTITTDIWK
jgi:hypothetical protein